jgi:hypothetical protein
MVEMMANASSHTWDGNDMHKWLGRRDGVMARFFICAANPSCRYGEAAVSVTG